MKQQLIAMFGGQGSQYYHMGKKLFENNRVFQNCMLELDELAMEYMKCSIVSEIYNPHKSMTDLFWCLKQTHPAIFMVEYALYQVLADMGIKPDALLGSSLGEFTCFALSGILSVEDTFECIVKQAELVERCCREGAMIAVLDKPDLYYEVPLIYENSELASVSYHSHFVLSGFQQKLAVVTQYFIEKKILYQKLPIAYGFHSAGIDEIQQEYMEFLKSKKWKKPSIPFISCMMGQEVSEINRGFIWEVVRKPILLQKTIQYLENIAAYTYIDCGPSATMANLTKLNLPKDAGMRCYSIMTLFQQEAKNLLKLESIC